VATYCLQTIDIVVSRNRIMSTVSDDNIVGIQDSVKITSRLHGF